MYPNNKDIGASDILIDQLFSDIMYTSVEKEDVESKMVGYMLITKEQYTDICEATKLGLNYNFNKLVENSRLGRGLTAYMRLDSYLYKKARDNNTVIIALNIQSKNIINMLTSEGYTKISKIYDYIKKDYDIKTDRDMYAYISKNRNNIDGVIGLHLEGDILFKGSRIVEYTDGLCCLYNTNVIKGYKIIKQ